MDDVTQHPRFTNIIWEAAQYRTLRAVVRADPQVGPRTARIIRDAFRHEAADDLRGLLDGE